MFAALGLGVAAMTYDGAEVTAAFHAQHSLPYPLLRDVERRHVEAYGILNEQFEPGSRGYGVPHPGIIYVAPDGTVDSKFAYPGYRDRPAFEAVLAAFEKAFAN